MSMPETQTQIAQDAIASIISSTDLATNFNPGTMNRAIVDMSSSIAANIEQQIVNLFYIASLNAIFQITDTTPLPAQPSIYLLLFTLSSTAPSPITLAVGTVVMVSGVVLTWSTNLPITISPGTSASVTATCTTPGAAGNVPSNVITVLQNAVTGLTVTNPSAQPITPGQDAETPSQTQARATNNLATIHRGDANAVAAGALTASVVDSSGTVIEQIVKATVYDYVTPGIAYLFAYNGTGNMSSTLFSNLTQIIKGYVDATNVVHVGYKSAGVQITIQNPNLYTVNVEGVITLYPGYVFTSVQALITQAINQFFSQLDIGNSLSFSQLLNITSSVNGVQDVVLNSPTQTLLSNPYITDPVDAPTCTGVTVSPVTTLSAGTYDVAYTYYNDWGETTDSSPTSVTITDYQAIQVSSLIPLPFGATGINYYVSTTVGGSTLGMSTSGSGAQINLTTVGNSTQPPTTNSAQVMGTLYVPGSIIINQSS